MNYIRKSTASTIVVGPFVNSGNGSTPETGLTTATVDIFKNGALATTGARSITHLQDGYYSMDLLVTDVDTLGRLRIALVGAGALPVWEDYMVLHVSTYDSFVARVSEFGLTIASPIIQNNDLTLYAGDDYKQSIGTDINFTDTADVWPDLTGATVRFISDDLSASGTVVTATGANKQVRFEFPAIDTRALKKDRYTYIVRATLSGGETLTLVRGKINVYKITFDG